MRHIHPGYCLPLAAGVAAELWLLQSALAAYSVFIVTGQACSHVVIVCSGVTALSSATFFPVHSCYTARGPWTASSPGTPFRVLISTDCTDYTPHWLWCYTLQPCPFLPLFSSLLPHTVVSTKRGSTFWKFLLTSTRSAQYS